MIESSTPSRRSPTWPGLLVPAVLLGLVGCSLQPPSSAGVAFSRRSIPANELRRGAEVRFKVDSETFYVWQTRVRIPPGVGWFWNTTPGTRQRMQERLGPGGPPFDSVQSVKHGSTPRRIDGKPMEGGWHLWNPLIAHANPRVGDTLVFPVTLVLADSSVVEWTGPPGSERPAPTIVVGRALPRLPVTATVAAAAVALVVLVVTGLLWVWHRRRSPLLPSSSPILEE